MKYFNKKLKANNIIYKYVMIKLNESLKQENASNKNF